LRALGMRTLRTDKDGSIAVVRTSGGPAVVRRHT
jgi:hypothetical protein